MLCQYGTACLSETGEDLQRKAKSITRCIEEIDLALSKPDPYEFLEAAAAVEVCCACARMRRRARAVSAVRARRMPACAF